MSIRLTLLAAAPGPALRMARFDDDQSLDERGLEAARAVAPALPPAARYFTAPSLRCRQTAETLGLSAVVEPALRDVDMGTWRGRYLGDLATEDPGGLGAWTNDSAAIPHGGESVSELCDRVGAWLDALPQNTGRVLAVTEPAVIRAAILHALATPPTAFWRIDVPPLSCARFTAHAGRWNLRLG
ncbi:MAG TPA: histidine phosphatase family protein [Streptomyces sp.]|nr:histidine phosphatase family protein [Streptomyces sp.]